jgi:phosphoglycolate phosphatase
VRRRRALAAIEVTELRLIAIDLDGTLVDSAPDIAHCLGVAMHATGRPAPDDARTRVWIGDGIEVLIERALSALPASRAAHDDFATALATFTSCYRSNLYTRSALYPDAAAVLDSLRDHGMHLCCITNKRLSFAEEVLRHAGVHDRFDLVLGGDSLAEKKPSALPLLHACERLGLAPSDAAMVGDSHHDLDAARAAGYARFFWASYGYCSVLNERPGDPVVWLGAFRELERLVIRA